MLYNVNYITLTPKTNNQEGCQTITAAGQKKKTNKHKIICYSVVDFL